METADSAPRQRFWAAWGWWMPPALIALVLILKVVDPFIGDWDGLDYTILALHGSPSSMALGRSLFIFYNHGLYLLAHSLFGLHPASAYLLFKYSVVAQGPLAVVAYLDSGAGSFAFALRCDRGGATRRLFADLHCLFGPGDDGCAGAVVAFRSSNRPPARPAEAQSGDWCCWAPRCSAQA